MINIFYQQYIRKNAQKIILHVIFVIFFIFPLAGLPQTGQPMIMSNGVSVPSNFPHINITINDNPDSGYIFIDNRGGLGNAWNIIFDNNGDPVWYLPTGNEERRDFKIQPNGWATMMIRGGYGDGAGFIALNEHYEHVHTFRAVDGYNTDEHEIKVLENGGYLLIGIRDLTVNMSDYIPGDNRIVTVSESCIQEFNANDVRLKTYAGFDYFDLADVWPEELLRSFQIRFPHMNAIDIDNDGNIILSSRHINEITKINRQTKEIIWRLGGAHSDFNFVNDPLNGFFGQHSVRVVGNNRYLLFDNGNFHDPPVSRAVEYELNTNTMTATLKWEYRNPPGTSYSYYMGNVQRLPNGNTLINWAVPDRPKLTEVRPNGTVAFEMNFVDQYECYRVHRFPWHGKAEKPYLIVESHTNRVSLIFNQFGDPDVNYYNIYGGTSPNPTTVLDTSKLTLKNLTNLENGRQYYFRVTSVTNGLESDYSNEESALVQIIQSGQNMVRNGDFSNAKENWTWELQGSGSAEWFVENGVSHFDISEGGPDIYDVQLRQNGIPLVQGEEYLFEFDAWADADRLIEAKVGQDGGSYLNYSKLGYSYITTQNQHFEYTFTMDDPSDLNSRVVFNTGTSDIDVYIDNISLKQKINQSSYTGSPQALPGKIECEEYDFGGEGTAYHDDNVKDGDLSFRPEDNVDVEVTPDNSNGYNVGWTNDGEWLEYTVHVEPGTYNIEYRTASEPGGGILKVILDGDSLTQFDVESTGGWQEWESLTKTGIDIKGGNNLILRLEIVSGDMNLNWIKFIKTASAVNIDNHLPLKFELSGNYPNPFNSETVISFSTQGTSRVKMNLYNILGKFEQELCNTNYDEGHHQIRFNGNNLSTGIHICVMEAINTNGSEIYRGVHKMILIK